jgi:transposase
MTKHQDVSFVIQDREQTIKDFKTNYPTLSKEFEKVQQEQYELFARKMLDYGIENIALGSSLEDPYDIHLSITGIWLRINDKINRLRNLLKRDGKNYVAGETMMDSFIDISNYGLIAMLVMRDKWKK